MTTINKEIEKLLFFAETNSFINSEDYIFTRNLLFDLLKIEKYIHFEITENINSANNILEKIIDYANEKNIITENNTTQRDLLSAKIMGIICPKPSEITKKFNKNIKKSGIEHATNVFYDFSKKINYIQCERIAKNEAWTTNTKYGDIQITINLSKPEKDPKEIALALNNKNNNYPKCPICIENVGFAGNYNMAPRQNLRIIPLKLCTEKWYFQYSPYLYYNEHCIVLSHEHKPMKIKKKTFKRLIDFTNKFPHYFIGSNADLPIVGGSILSHDHFQGGKHNFPMAQAPIDKNFENKNFNKIKAGIVNWPMSVIRLQSKSKKQIIKAAMHIFKAWKNYSNPQLDIFPYTNQIPHNTITPVARKKNNIFELDIVLRNNKTNENFPDGIFHPHSEIHHLKKENIGLIEVSGLAILPGRLKTEIADILKQFSEDIDYEENKSLEKHKEWINYLKKIYKNNISQEDIQNEIAYKFVSGLEHCGVFKRNLQGQDAFSDFLEKINFKPAEK